MTAREEHITIKKSARLYVLGDLETAAEVWIVCHGYGQLAGKFIDAFDGIVTTKRAVVAPEGLHRFYLDPPPAPAAERRVGATWMTREDRESDIRDNVAYLDAVAAHVVGAQVERLRVLGFSQGCATVFRWAVLGAMQIDELILWSGEVPPDVDLTPAAQRLARTRVMVAQGVRDELALSGATQRQLQQLAAAGLAPELYEHGGGHRLDSNLLAMLAARSS